MDNLDVDIQQTQRGVQNDDKPGLLSFKILLLLSKYLYTVPTFRIVISIQTVANNILSKTS